MRRKNLFQIALIALIVLPLAFSGVLVKAPPVPIGDPAYKQSNPFDSNPTTGSSTGVGTVTGTFPGNVIDGDFSTSVNWFYGGGADGVPGYVAVSAFKKPSDNGLTDFTITWIDIKVSYKAGGVSGQVDQYRIVANVSDTRVVLLDWVTGVEAKYDPGLGSQSHRVFSKVTEPIDGVWTWTDLANLEVIFECLRAGTLHFQRVYLYEVWVTAYSTSYPAPSTVSVRPSAVIGLHTDDLFYVDIYVTNVAEMWGYQIVLNFSSSVLTALEYFSYGPFVSEKPSEIGPDYVSVTYGTYDGDPTGFTGNTPATRIYFQVVADGACVLKLSKAVIANVYGSQIPLAIKDGVFASNPVHDVAVIDVTVNATSVLPGEHLEVNATVMNLGTYIEAVDVTAFYDTTNSIGTQTITALDPGLSEDVSLVWDTTDISLGFHQISVEATVPVDDIPGNNVKVWNLVPEGVLVGRHDVAVTNIIRAYENGTVAPVGGILNVTRGDTVHINVTLANVGNFSETFDITGVWKGAFGIGNITDISLDAGAAKNVTFVWNTDVTSPPWQFDLDRWGRPVNFSRGDIKVVAAPDWSGGIAGIKAKGVPYEKSILAPPLGHDYLGNNFLVTMSVVEDVRVNRDLRYPTAKFSISPLNLYVGQPADFFGGPPTYSQTPLGTTIIKYRWDFGDGNVTEGDYPTIKHAYSSSGTYYVNLTVFNDIDLNASVRTGQTGAPVGPVVVTGRNVKIVSVDVSPTSAVVGQNVTIGVTLKNDSPRDENLATTNKNITIYYGDDLVGRMSIPDIGAHGTATDTRTAVFNWTTPGWGPGVRTVKVVLDVLPYENNTDDNTLIFAEMVTLLWHNIKITELTTSKTEATVGDSVSISVTVLNQGNFSETFTVTVYYNDTALSDVQTVTDLAPGESKVLEFTWNTADLNSGIYVLKAVASDVTDEAVTSDNSFVGGSVTLNAASNLLIYIVIGAVAVIVVLAVVGVYFLKFRKPK